MLHVCMPFHWIAQRIFNKIKVWAMVSSSYPSLPLCQILFRGLHCWASPSRKIGYTITHSPSLFDAPGSEEPVMLHRIITELTVNDWSWCLPSWLWHIKGWLLYSNTYVSLYELNNLCHTKLGTICVIYYLKLKSCWLWWPCRCSKVSICQGCQGEVGWVCMV